jgi:hypothetical protein
MAQTIQQLKDKVIARLTSEGYTQGEFGSYFASKSGFSIFSIRIRDTWRANGGVLTVNVKGDYFAKIRAVSYRLTTDQEPDKKLLTILERLKSVEQKREDYEVLYENKMVRHRAEERFFKTLEEENREVFELFTQNGLMKPDLVEENVKLKLSFSVNMEEARAITKLLKKMRKTS